MEPIGRDKVVTCTLSGWAYRVAFIINIFASGLFDVRRRNLVGLSDFIQRLLFLVELGFGQACNICDRNFCQDIPFKGLTKASTYVWQVTECDNKVFAAILDFSSQFSDQFLVFTLEELVKLSCFFPVILRKVTDSFDGCVDRGTGVLRSYLRTFSARRIAFQSLAASAVYEDRISPDDFGFDLFFAETSDILSGKATFEPITTSGFRELSPAPDCGLDRPIEGAFGFDPFSATDDGIRTMVCHTDKNGNAMLVMGSAVFGLNQASNTYTLDLS